MNAVGRFNVARPLPLNRRPANPTGGGEPVAYASPAAVASAPASPQTPPASTMKAELQALGSELRSLLDRFVAWLNKQSTSTTQPSVASVSTQATTTYTAAALPPSGNTLTLPSNWASSTPASTGLATVPATTAPSASQPQTAPATVTTVPAVNTTGGVPGRDGVLVPLYMYPSDAQNNPDINALIAEAKKYPNVPVYAIINVDSNAGTSTDPNFQVEINRLKAAGIHCLGYVDSNNATNSQQKVEADIDQWGRLYQGIDGIMVDQMQNTGSQASVDYYKAITNYAHSRGFSTVIDNAGTDVPDAYFAQGAADEIITHEDTSYPSAQTLQSQTAYDGRRALVVYGQNFDANQVNQMKQHANLLYVTNDSGDNPYDTLPPYLDSLFAAVNGQTSP